MASKAKICNICGVPLDETHDQEECNWVLLERIRRGEIRVIGSNPTDQDKFEKAAKEFEEQLMLHPSDTSSKD